MADTVTTQTILDGPRNCVMAFTNISDGTGENAVKKVDIAALSGSPTRVKLERIEYSAAGMGVDILWDATTDVLAFHVPANTAGEIDFRREGRVPNPKTSGWTGHINFTTVDAANGDRYSVVLHMTKGY